MSKNLTKKQKDVLDFIMEFMRDNSYPPSVREICLGIGVKSTSTVHGYLQRLEKNGYIKRDSTKTRSIVIDNTYIDENRILNHNELINVPVVGRVAAGEPILAQENIEDTFPIPSNYLRSGEYFLLNISGQSMIQAGILDGDYVLVKQQNDAKNGDIVVALLDDSATVKTFYREKEYIKLQPENDTMSPIFTKDLQILGIVRGVFRFM
ncbi:MAG: transcriptional repressor LexA [Clostridiales bacterium]|nr:transcriptional repressor LexA [Clostridiales bacterium]